MIPDSFHTLGFQLAFLIGTPIVALLVITAVLVTWGWHTNTGHNREEWGFAAATVGLVALLGVIIWTVVALPLNPAYWQDYRVEGQVLTVSNTWTDDGGDMARTPVATLDTVDRPLVIDDPRAVTLQGEHVVLTCSIDWHFRAADSYSCRIAQIGRTGQK